MVERRVQYQSVEIPSETAAILLIIVLITIYKFVDVFVFMYIEFAFNHGFGVVIFPHAYQKNNC